MLEKNFNGKAERAILTTEEYSVNVGDIIEIGKHWTTADAVDTIGNACENVTGDYITVFKCDNIVGHEVEYEKLNEDDEDEYDAEYAYELAQFGISEGCEDEQEVIVENAKFEVISIETEEYYGSEDEDGIPGVRTIKVRMI